MKARIRSGWLLALSALALAGCVGFRLVPPGAVRAGPVEVTTPVAWNRLSAPMVPSHLEMWTADGMPLDQFLVVKGLEAGKTLMDRSPGERGEPLPTFRASMGPDEVVEFVFATFQQIGRGRSYELTQLAPARFGEDPGFRFGFRTVGRNDIEREGMALGAVVDGRLYMLLFEGTRLRHFPARQREVEEMMRSARILRGA